MTIDSVPVQHDPKGNLTADETGQTYAWDFDNHLKSVDVDGDMVADVTARC